MNSTGDIKGYAIARRTLIEALLALAPLPAGSVVLVGAHAVYLRAPAGIASIPSFTFDGDLAADPRKIRRPRVIRERLEAAGFSLRGGHSGFYSIQDAPVDERYASKLDILVPDGSAHLWEKEGYNSADVSATAVQPGLEVCLVDHSAMTLGPIDAEHHVQTVSVEVAGIVALLVAKGWKVGERFEQGPDAFKEVVKDIADIYRLLRVSKVDDIRIVLGTFPERSIERTVTTKGARYLRDICSAGGAGIALLRTIVGNGNEADIMLASLDVLAQEFHQLVEDSFGSRER